MNIGHNCPPGGNQARQHHSGPGADIERADAGAMQLSWSKDVRLGAVPIPGELLDANVGTHFDELVGVAEMVVEDALVDPGVSFRLGQEDGKRSLEVGWETG